MSRNHPAGKSKCGPGGCGFDPETSGVKLSGAAGGAKFGARCPRCSSTKSQSPMNTVYFKRFRMEIDLRKVPLPEPTLPDAYSWTAWRSEWLERHAWTKAESFHDEIDAEVFASLADYGGCLHLMREIARRDEFLPHATWLITRGGPHDEDREDCGTIQGLATRPSGLFASGPIGAIQNVGSHRDIGVRGWGGPWCSRR